MLSSRVVDGPRTATISLVAIVPLLLLLSNSSSAQTVLTGEQAIARMQANDALFQNVLAEYVETRCFTQEKHEPERIPTKLHIDESVDQTGIPTERELWKLLCTYVAIDRDSPPGPIPAGQEKWVQLMMTGKIRWKAINPPQAETIETIKRDCRIQMGIRWPNLATRRQSSPQSWKKFRVIDDRTDLLFAVACGTNRNWFLSSDDITYIPNPYQRSALWLQFAIGIGYSQIISDVTSFEPHGDGYKMQVKIDWWSHATGDGTLVLDKSLVVRSADISYGKSQFSVTSQGKYHVAGRPFQCASTGHFELQSLGETGQFDVAVTSIRFDMTDEQFGQLADMASPLNEPRYEMENNGPVRTIRDTREHAER